MDPADLGGRDARNLVEAVAAVRHWLDLSPGLVAAALSEPLRIDVTATADAGATVEAVLHQDRRVRIEVARPLAVDAAALRTALLDGVLAAVEEAARRWPHAVPPRMWRPPSPEDAPEDVPTVEDEVLPLAVTIEMLQADELLLLARLDGAAVDEEERLDELDEYVVSRAEGSGIAVVDDGDGGDHSAAWIISLSRGPLR